ncbi:MAG: GvpL/GvpF family gas vesicle protein [Candidatus Omnitrophica bacterium]|nr:GvpL/GvpF family gas vesicle protein [Candidatus Omnitrophota bacterium]
MEKLYLYCIREKSKRVPSISAKGIDPQAEVFILSFRQLEAVVSKVSLGEFGSSSQIQKKAQDDPNWIKEKVLLHHQVIEKAMKDNGRQRSLIPMRFGIMFEQEKKLREALRKDYSRINEVLENLKGKQEWSLKVYLRDRRKLEKTIEANNEIIAKKQKEIDSLDEGTAFFLEEELKEIVSRQIGKQINTITKQIGLSLKKYSNQIVENKVLQKEISGRPEPMVFNASFLILDEKVKQFKQQAHNLAKQIEPQGLNLEYNGPWAAYNFSQY